MALNNIDLVSIQECLDSYRKLIEWLPIVDDGELDMKIDRLKTIDYLIKACEEEMSK